MNSCLRAADVWLQRNEFAKQGRVNKLFWNQKITLQEKNANFCHSRQQLTMQSDQRVETHEMENKEVRLRYINKRLRLTPAQKR